MIFIPTPFNFTLFVFQQNNLCNLCKSTQNLHSDTISTAWLFVPKTSTDNFITTPLWKDSVGWCHFRQCQLVSFPTVSAGTLPFSRCPDSTSTLLGGWWVTEERREGFKQQRQPVCAGVISDSVGRCHFRQCWLVSFLTVSAGVISDSVGWSFTIFTMSRQHVCIPRRLVGNWGEKKNSTSSKPQLTLSEMTPANSVFFLRSSVTH